MGRKITFVAAAQTCEKSATAKTNQIAAQVQGITKAKRNNSFSRARVFYFIWGMRCTQDKCGAANNKIFIQNPAAISDVPNRERYVNKRFSFGLTLGAFYRLLFQTID